MKNLTIEDNITAFKNRPEFSGKELVLVDFYATWCEPCKWLDDILEKIQNEISGFTKIIKVNIDSNPNLATHFEIKSVPVLILFKNGNIVWRINGFLNAPDLAEKLISFR